MNKLLSILVVLVVLAGCGSPAKEVGLELGSSILVPPAVTYGVGDTGPAGGIIFYVTSNASLGWTYLEAASSNVETSKAWGVKGEDVPSADESAIGTGEQNTLDIVNKYSTGSYAANYCYELVVANNGVDYDDWFLPSDDELILMYDNIGQGASGIYANIGGFADDCYWSSSEMKSTAAFFENFDAGSALKKYKDNALIVRPIRAF